MALESRLKNTRLSNEVRKLDLMGAFFWENPKTDL